MPIAPRPPIRWFHSLTDLDDFALISWAVDPARVQAVLPIHAGVQRRTVFDVHTPPTRVR